MVLLLLQAGGFLTGFCTSVYAGYYFLLDPALIARYKHVALLEEIRNQLCVEESRMTAELSALESMRQFEFKRIGIPEPPPPVVPEKKRA